MQVIRLGDEPPAFGSCVRGASPGHRERLSARPPRVTPRYLAGGLALALLTAFVPNPARAQPWLFDLSWPGMNQDEVNRMQAAAARLYEGRSIGTIERWRNPDTKAAGEVKLVRSFDAYGMPCRTLDYTVRFESARNSPNHYVVNWCKVQGDRGADWKIVELAPRR